MALRSNSKKAVENIRQYIRDGYNPDGYELQEPDTFPALASQLLQVFRSEKYHLPQDVRYYHGSEQAAFADWCAGLPSILDTCYFYNRSAVADLANILQETPEEASRYTEQDAEQLLTWLIYRELKKGERKA